MPRKPFSETNYQHPVIIKCWDSIKDEDKKTTSSKLEQLTKTFIKEKGEEARLQEEISPQQKIAQREYNIEMIKFAVGGGLIVIGIIGVIFGLYGLVALGVSDINNLGGKILLGILVGIPFIVFIVPGYYIVRSAYRKRYISKH